MSRIDAVTPHIAAKKEERLHYMDAMRGVLMMLGVVLHSSQVFSTDGNWLISSKLTASIANELVIFIHIFRMPAFFVVSGFFCYFTLKRYGASDFLRIRLKRIIIPLLVTALTFNSLQTWILIEYAGLEFSAQNYLFQGGWVSHLWFLINLSIYFMLAFVLTSLLIKPTTALFNKLEYILLSEPMLTWVFILPMFSVLIKAANKWGLPVYSNAFGFIDVYCLLCYAPFFFMGCLLASNQELLKRFSSVGLFTSAFIAVSAVFFYELYEMYSGVFYEVARTYMETLAMWSSTVLCFGLFMRFANRVSFLFSWLADASYSVYLFHHLLVIIFGLILISLGIGGNSGLLLLILIVAASAGLMHQFVVKQVPAISLLFNGKLSA